MPGLWCHSQRPSKSRPTRRGATNLWPALLQPPPPHAIQTLPSTSKTTGSIEELIPISYHRAFFPSPPLLPPAWCFSEFSCLFVCLFCSVSMLASLSLPQTQNTFIFLCPTQTRLNARIKTRFPQHWIALMMQAGAYLWAARKHD